MPQSPLTPRRSISALLAPLGVLGWALFLVGAVSPTSPARVGVISSQRVTADSKVIQQLLAEASAPAQSINDEVRSKQAALNKATERYNAQLSVTQAEENGRRRAEIRTLEEEIEELAFRLNRELKRAQESAVNPLRDHVISAVNEIAREMEISVIIGVENTIYFDPAIDLTSAVVARIDAQ